LRIADCGLEDKPTPGGLVVVTSPNEFKDRTKKFAVRVIRLVDSLPQKRSTDILGKQLLRAASSVGANYRAACRGRSKDEFCAKLGIVEEEGDECVYWLEVLVEAELVPDRLLAPLLTEANEIVAMVVSSIRTARNRR
jgi:four helix bundle protein